MLREQSPEELTDFAGAMGGLVGGDIDRPWVPYVVAHDQACEEVISGLRRHTKYGPDGPKFLFGLTVSDRFSARCSIVEQACMVTMSIAVPIRFRALARSLVGNGAALLPT